MHIFVSGDHALDFVGTLKWRRREQPEELLSTPAALDAWFVESGLLSQPPGSSAEDLSMAVRLREAVYRVVEAALDGRPRQEADAALINMVAAEPPVTPALRGPGRTTVGSARQARSSVARAAIDVVTRGDGTPMKECGRPECTRVYLDRSHGHRRTWCGMDECGNRVKAAAYRQRRRARTQS